MLLEFAFDTLHVRRLEARAAVQNGRGNGALIKVGAVQEAILRKSFVKNGRTYDQVLFAILEQDWRAGRDADVRELSRARALSDANDVSSRAGHNHVAGLFSLSARVDVSTGLGRDRSTTRSTSPGTAWRREGRPVRAPAGYDRPSRLTRSSRPPRPG